MKKQYTILAMMEGRGFDFFESEKKALEMQADRVGQEAPESELLSIVENVAIIEIKGQLTNKNSWYNRYCGLISYDQIREAIVEAVELGVGSILFDGDGPGGSVAGMKDLSNFIQNLDVPTIFHTSGTAASALYFLGISTEKFYADSMSEVGSIGVVMTLMEYTEQMKKAGVHAEVFRSGKHKQAGNPYEKLSAENRKYMKDQVMTYANKFYEFVSEQRGIPLPAMEEIMTGKTFIGEEALTAGLVDKIMSFDEALAEAIILAEKTLDTGEQTGNYQHGYSLNKGASAREGEKTMAKKFSKQHLAALVKAGKGIDTPAPDASDNKKTELTAEELAAIEAENETETTETGDDPAMVEASKLTEMTEKFDTSQVELADLTSKLEEAGKNLTSTVAAHEEAIKPMVDAICGQIDGMRIALSLSSVDMKEWEPSAIMKEHENVSATFEKSFVTGGVVPPEGDDKKVKESATRADANNIKNLAF